MLARLVAHSADHFGYSPRGVDLGPCRYTGPLPPHPPARRRLQPDWRAEIAGRVPRHPGRADGAERPASLETALPEKRTGSGVPRAAGRHPAAHPHAGPVPQAVGKGRGDHAVARPAPLRRVALDRAGLLDQGGDDLRRPFLHPDDHGTLRSPVPLAGSPKGHGHGRGEAARLTKQLVSEICD